MCRYRGVCDTVSSNGVPACLTALVTSSLATTLAGAMSWGYCQRRHASVARSRPRLAAPTTGCIVSRMRRGAGALYASTSASCGSAQTATMRSTPCRASDWRSSVSGTLRITGTPGHRLAR